MERAKTPRLNPFIKGSLIVLVILCVAYVPLKLYLVRSGRGTEPPPDGASLSIFVTSELQGYREPHG